MRKQLFLSADNVLTVMCLFVSLCLISCSEMNDEDSDAVSLSSRPIIFEIMENNTKVTRAAITTVSDMTQYGVYGITTSGGKIATNSVYTLEDGNWNSSSTMYWPSETVLTNFFAINGSFSDIATKISFTKSNRRFNYTTLLDADNQLDLMVASALNMKESTNNGKVSLSFNHIMCYLLITVQSGMGDEYIVEFGKVSIHNVDVTGKITFDKNVNSKAEVVLQEDYQTIFRDMTENPFVLTSEKQIMPAVGDYFIMFQQKLTKWKTTDANAIPISQADEEHHSYVEIDCKIKDLGGNYIFGSDTEWGKAYMPFTASFTKQNQSKTANIKFTGGYDENGVPLSFGSGFEIIAEDWEDGNENNEPIEVEF